AMRAPWAAALAVLAVLLHGRAQHPAGARPNFIVILADDLGWGDLGANWPSTKETPHLDELAEQGTSSVLARPAPAPTRSALSWRAAAPGVRSSWALTVDKGLSCRLPSADNKAKRIPTATTFHGFSAGKWHLGHHGRYHPNFRGFEYYFGIPYSNDMGCTDTPGCNLPPCPACARLAAAPSHVRRACYTEVALPLLENLTIVQQPVQPRSLAALYAESARRFVQRARRPFFLYVALAHMHVPLAAPCAGAYGAALRDMDALVGSLKRAADGAGAGKTLLWFAGDNGPWAQKCELAGDVGPFVGAWQRPRGGSSAKQTTWEGGHRVPALAYWPGRIPANRSSAAGAAARGAGQTLRCGLRGDLCFLLQLLLHPNSGAAGRDGEIEALRLAQYKVFYTTGGAQACDGSVGPEEHHEPPLIFDLNHDMQEQEPLDVASREYQALLPAVRRAYAEALQDIATDNVSVADYSQDPAAIPCCSTRHVGCRCHA
ncbi:ARSG Arylsulfatase, partial [Nothocercus julius]|nr:ARSG Arylsulfatase [Nothocercus julius]